jgi:hypothetical protein
VEVHGKYRQVVAELPLIAQSRERPAQKSLRSLRIQAVQWRTDMTRGLEYAGIDVFRLNNDGKIVEQRDVLQTLPTVSENEKRIF